MSTLFSLLYTTSTSYIYPLSLHDALPILFNGAHMPVAPELAGSLIQRGNLGQYTVMSSATHLNLLGDWIKLGPLPDAYSIGDVLIAIGLAIVVFLAVRNPGAHKELTRP